MLVSRSPIKKNFLSNQQDEGPLFLDRLEALNDQAARVGSATVVIAQTLEVALKLIQEQNFSFVISDLLLFDPKLVNKIREVNYFPELPLEDGGSFEGRRSQITHPSGLRFIKTLRTAER
jgi:hypothetical protein